MLQLTRLSGPIFALNPDLIERAEATPDTVVTLVNGSKYVVRETLDELIELVRDYRAGVVVAAEHAAQRAAQHPDTEAGHSRHARSAGQSQRSHDAGSRANVVLLHAENGEV